MNSEENKWVLVVSMDRNHQWHHFASGTFSCELENIIALCELVWISVNTCTDEGVQPSWQGR